MAVSRTPSRCMEPGTCMIWKATQELRMESSKQVVQEVLDRLPDDCTPEDVQYHLTLLRPFGIGESLHVTNRPFCITKQEHGLRMANRLRGRWQT